MTAKEILKTLTLEEKIGQLEQTYGKFLLRRDPETGETEFDPLGMTDEERATVGSVLNNSKTANASYVLKTYLSDEVGGKVPLIAMHDVIHGCDTIYPIPLGLACSLDETLVEECSFMAGEEAASRNIHITFAPMVDLVRDARWGRVMESSGEDTLINQKMAVATINGFHKAGVGCCVKHFAGYGFAESGRDYNNANISERLLKEQVLPPFKSAVDAGVDMVMVSYSSINDIPSTADERLIKDVLRMEMGFEGLVISDSNSIFELIGHGVAQSPKEAAELAFNAGIEIDMSSVCYIKELKKLVAEGKISEAEIDEICLKILELKEKYGVLKRPYIEENESTQNSILKPENIKLAQKAAEKSAVLLKNNGVLPLSENVKKIALIGPFADHEEIIGAWRCFGDKQYGKGVISTVKKSFEARLTDCEIMYVPGCEYELDDKTTDFSEAINAAKSADAVILCIGENMNYSGEAKSRANISLPTAQLNLAKEVCEVNKNTAVVLFNGRPLAIPELDEFAPAILTMWQPGTAGGAATVSLLMGDKVPQGKLTMSWPYSVGQCPIYYNNTPTGRRCQTPEQEHNHIHTMGFKSNYIDEYSYPLYPFGYGLSYTTFEYSDAFASSDVMTSDAHFCVSVKVKNQGNFKAIETVQLYIRDVVGSVVRPIKQLKDYKKLELIPGEEKTVTFEINDEMLKFVRRDMTYGLEEGEFEAQIGSNSRDVITVKFNYKK